MAPRLTENSFDLIDSHEGRLQRVETAVGELAVDVKELSTKHDYTQSIIQTGFKELSEKQTKKFEWRMNLLAGAIIAIIGAVATLGLERLLVHHP